MPAETPSDPHGKALAPFRAQIDELDRQIVELLLSSAQSTILVIVDQ